VTQIVMCMRVFALLLRRASCTDAAP